MLSRLGRDTLIYGVSTLLVRGIQIVLIPVYTRVLGSGDYGMVETLAVLGALVNLTVALEISQGMARYMADGDAVEHRQGYASTAVLFSVMAYGLFVVIAAMGSLPLSRWLFGGHGNPSMLLVAIGALAVNGVFVLLQDLLRWQLKPLSYLAASLCYSIVIALVGISLVAGAKMGVCGVFWGQLAGAVAGGLVSWFFARGLLSPEFDPAKLRRMLAYSLPLVLSGAAVFGNLFTDRIVVREILGIDALGIYGVAARFASVIAILSVGLQAALLPLVFRGWRDPATAVMLGRAFRYYCLAMIPIAGGIALFSGEIFLSVTGPSFHSGRTVLPLLALASMLSTLYIFSPGLFIGKRTGLVAVVNISGAAVNIGLSLLLVPQFGLHAAALTAGLASASVFCGFLFLGRFYYSVPYDPMRVAVSLSSVVLLVVLGLIWNAPSPGWDLTRIVLKAAVLAAACTSGILLAIGPEDRSVLARRLNVLQKKIMQDSN